MFAVFDLFGKVDAGRIYMVYLDSESKEHLKTFYNHWSQRDRIVTCDYPRVEQSQPPREK